MYILHLFFFSFIKKYYCYSLPGDDGANFIHYLIFEIAACLSIVGIWYPIFSQKNETETPETKWLHFIEFFSK